MRTDEHGELIEVDIGPWRSIAASRRRRLAEVRLLNDERVAVRIERFADDGKTPTSVTWQLYDCEGRLESDIQSTPNGVLILLTNYRTRQACRLKAAADGALQPVETWTI
jgi:hypothetical protein